ARTVGANGFVLELIRRTLTANPLGVVVAESIAALWRRMVHPGNSPDVPLIQSKPFTVAAIGEYKSSGHIVRDDGVIHVLDKPLISRFALEPQLTTVPFRCGQLPLHSFGAPPFENVIDQR